MTKNKKKKKKTYEVSPALLYSGLIPVIRKPIDIYGNSVYITIWFDNIVVRKAFMDKMGDEIDGYQTDTIHISKLEKKEYKTDLMMGKVIYKVGKKKIRSISLKMLFEFYKQYVDNFVDK